MWYTYSEQGKGDLVKGDGKMENPQIFKSCEKCTNTTLILLKICDTCYHRILAGVLQTDQFYCDECHRLFPIESMMECRSKGDEINRCRHCAERHVLEYE